MAGWIEESKRDYAMLDSAVTDVTRAMAAHDIALPAGFSIMRDGKGWALFYKGNKIGSSHSANVLHAQIRMAEAILDAPRRYRW